MHPCLLHAAQGAVAAFLSAHELRPPLAACLLSHPHPAALQTPLARVCSPPRALSRNRAGRDHGSASKLTCSHTSQRVSYLLAAFLCRDAQGGQTPGRPRASASAAALSLAVGGRWHQACYIVSTQLSAIGCFEGPGAIKRGQEHPKRSPPLCSWSRRAERLLAEARVKDRSATSDLVFP